jgi:hypothetical protein
MAYADIFFKPLSDQFFDVLDVTQQLVLTNASAFVESAKSLTPPAETIPFSDRLPDPVAVSDGVFGFAEKVLVSQRDFTHKLLEIYAVPAAPNRTTPARAAATKSS